MTFIDLASICFAVAAAASLLTGIVEVVMSEEEQPADWNLVSKSLAVGLTLTGVALWSWRLSEGLGAFAEALK